MNIQEDFVSFEIAKLLKEKGYKCSFNSYYNDAGCVVDRPNILLKEPEYQYYERVSLYMAMKWLREVHYLWIGIDPLTGYKWSWSIWLMNDPNLKMGESSQIISNYKEACEEAIKYCLKVLITSQVNK